MMKSRFFLFLVVLFLVFASIVHSVGGKRAFAIRMRAKTTSIHSRAHGRKHGHGYQQEHEVSGLVKNPQISDAQPARPVGWDIPTHPLGPPPAYPGLGHHHVLHNGPPPAYSLHHLNPPTYEEAMRGYHVGHFAKQHDNHGGYLSSYHSYAVPRYAATHYPYNHDQNVGGVYAHSKPSEIYNGYGADYGYHRGPFSFGNILTGMALWQVARGFNSYNFPHQNDRDRIFHEIILPPTASPPPVLDDTEPQPLPEEHYHIQVNSNFDFGEVLQPLPAEDEKDSKSTSSSEIFGFGDSSSTTLQPQEDLQG